MAEVGIEPPNSHSGVRGSTTMSPRSPIWVLKLVISHCCFKDDTLVLISRVSGHCLHFFYRAYSLRPCILYPLESHFDIEQVAQRATIAHLTTSHQNILNSSQVKDL